MGITTHESMGEQIVACPECEKHINFSLIELTADEEIRFVQQREIAPGEDYEVHETRCPEGHSFWYAATTVDPLDL
jgi:hypothetical protein